MKIDSLLPSTVLRMGMLLVVVSMVGCGGAQDSALDTTVGQVGAGSATGSTCPAGSTLTYANFGQAFISTNCLSCHGSRQSPILATQSAIQAASTQIDRMAAAGPDAVNTAMPPNGSVSTSDRLNLGQWLACGAP
jgi:argininosuccinate lyase